MPVSATEFLKLRPWTARAFKRKAPEWFKSYPTMLSLEEMHMLSFLASEYGLPSGAVVDLGPFLGGSTVSLGFNNNRNIHSFDRFHAGDSIKDKFYHSRGYPHYKSTDTLPLFKSLIAERGVSSTAYKGDVCHAEWNEPIALLFIDVAKSWAINDHLVNAFFPHLLEGSIIVQQDFMFYRNPWVCVTMYLLRDVAEFAGHTDFNSLVFRMKRRPDRLARCLAENVTKADVLASFDWAGTLIKDFRAIEMVDMMRRAYLASPDGTDVTDFNDPGTPEITPSLAS